MIKLSDYLMEFLARRGVDAVFTVSGGGIMHLLDSLGRNPRLKYYCNHHEQASAICAEGYARITGRPAAVLVTVGPGAVNAISGMAGAWYDGVPMIVIAGQVRTGIIADYSSVRQFGPQEANTVGMASSVSKYANTVLDPKTIRRELEKAWHLAVSGRPGPVFLDIPLDVQSAMIDPNEMAGFEPATGDGWDRGALTAAVSATLERLAQARRPVLLGGTGVRMGGAETQFLQLAERLNVPVIIPYSSKDLIPEEHPLNMGVIGTAGQRRANFTVQNSDLLISCATGLSVTKIGFNTAGFAAKAFKVVVDIDQGQLHGLAVKPDLAVHAHVREFLDRMLAALEGRTFSYSPDWLPACREWRERYPVIVDDFYKDPNHVNSYVFMDALSDHLGAGDIIATGNGIDITSFYQAFRVKAGQRTVTSNNWGSMGWGLPQAIGACLANARRRTVCVSGDGSLQWNLQELLFIQYHRLPVVLFVFNNGGYTCIRTTQDNFFEGRYVGSDSGSGVGDLNYEKLAATYGMPYYRIGNNNELARLLPTVLSQPGPVLCDVSIARTQGISPKASAFRRPDGTLESRPLEDMAPFLPRDEIHSIMHRFDRDGDDLRAEHPARGIG
jgi:acetolactate synthase-1/2/3 large subunit